MSASLTRPAAARRAKDADHNKRRMIVLMEEIKNQEEAIRQGGGPKGIEAQHRKGRLAARERIEKLVDPPQSGTCASFFELGLYAAHEMYQEWGGTPAAGVVTGLARVCGRPVMIWALEAASLNPEVREFRTGVLQT
jgi:3-methylcrotonyl-CoA carboxylase beta subunit